MIAEEADRFPLRPTIFETPIDRGSRRLRSLMRHTSPRTIRVAPADRGFPFPPPRPLLLPARQDELAGPFGSRTGSQGCARMSMKVTCFAATRACRCRSATPACWRCARPAEIFSESPRRPWPPQKSPTSQWSARRSPKQGDRHPKQRGRPKQRGPESLIRRQRQRRRESSIRNRDAPGGRTSAGDQDVIKRTRTLCFFRTGDSPSARAPIGASKTSDPFVVPFVVQPSPLVLPPPAPPSMARPDSPLELPSTRPLPTPQPIVSPTASPPAAAHAAASSPAVWQHASFWVAWSLASR